MNKNDLFNIIGDISEDLIMEASNPAKTVRRIRISKVAVVAAVIVVLLGLTVFASGVLIRSSSSHSSIVPDYYTVPSQQTLQNDIGISPCVVEKFSNGYEFKSGGVAENENFGEDGSVFERYKSLYCQYIQGEDSITLYIDASIAGIQMENSETSEIYHGSKIKYFSYTNKLVPGNYQLTEQDKKDKESGKYIFSYGSDDIEIHEVQGLGWEYGGLSYSLTVIDNNITKDELIQMAKEIIDYQK